MLKKVARIAQSCLLLIIGIALFLWPNGLPMLPWKLEKIIGITIALGAGIIFYFDHKLDSLSPRQQILSHTNIADGLDRAQKYVKKPHIIRILAFSTYRIQPIMRELGFNTKECTVLIYKPEAGPVEEWFDMMTNGSISELHLKRIDLYPMSYFIIFDDRALLLGHYIIKATNLKCEVQEPCLILDKTEEGKLIIRKYLEVFDNLAKSDLSHTVELGKSNERTLKV